MSQDFMDPELFADFIIEAKEHLETIEPNLLELEKAPDNLSLLNEIFRPMHSLKGASGFMGLNRMNTLAHRAENILDELRKGNMTVNSEIMDIILASTDALRQMIDSLETTNTEGEVDISALVEKLDALMTNSGVAIAAPSVVLASSTPAPAPEAAAPVVEAPAPAPEAAPVVETPAAATQAVEAPVGESEASPGGRQGFNVETWLETRANLPSYALTAFGEGHLRDFIEEAKENFTNLSDGLLELEKHPDNHDLINDLFRFFHNLKGNSGIVGFLEMNSLTHEAETLLNAVRKDEYPVTSPLVDMLLLSVDMLEALVYRIDIPAGQVAPFDTSELLDKLRQAVAGGTIEMPASLIATAMLTEDEDAPAAAPAEGKDAAADPASAASSTSTATIGNDDVLIFKDTVSQQFNTIKTALAGMRMDGANRDFADAMYRSLVTLQNSSGFMGLEDIKTYAQRTAGIVDQGRITSIDFSMMADLLEQECSIIEDMLTSAIEKMLAATPATTETPKTVLPTPAGAAPAPKAEPAAAPAPAPAAPKPAPVAEAKPAPVEAPKPAAPAPAPAAPAAAPAPKPAAAPAAAPAKADDAHGGKASSTIRVDHEKLDHLMNTIGELIINRNRYSMLARQLEDIDTNLPEISAIAQNLSETTYAMARISDDLQDTIMKVRMLPVSSVFSRFPRLVRDLSRKSGKEVELIMAGEDTELDKSVVEVIGDPLVHLIRNSVDHGIESEEVRRGLGKNPKGNVWLRAYYKGNSVAIEIEDDGKGIDPEKMREVAVRKGVITPEEAKNLDDRESMELIFAPGFSSAEVITDISGRGVGMDVVRTNIKNLKGSIAITSEVNKGTKFILSLPLTLAIIDALMVNVGKEMFAIPLDAVSETTKIEARRLTDVKGRKAVTLRGEVLGIVNLSELLGIPSEAHKQEVLSVLVIQDHERRLGLVVDRLLERQEVVIKPLGAYLGDLQGISGATIMGDGSVILILDPHEIYSLATSRAG